ncbi:MAG: pyridoxamine 5'-phosphate oxidase family protein [Acidimicrobiales bacterium]
MSVPDHGALVRSIIDANLYMVLATADEAGRPWASPVYFAVAGYREFFWVSSPEATHSRNIAVRPDVGIVVFDSRAPIGTGQGVYMPAVAQQLTAGSDLQRGIDIFSRRSLAHGGRPWTLDAVRDPEPIRLHRATATGHSILAKDGRPDHRLTVAVQAPTDQRPND